MFLSGSWWTPRFPVACSPVPEWERRVSLCSSGSACLHLPAQAGCQGSESAGEQAVVSPRIEAQGFLAIPLSFLVAPED